MKAQVLVLVTLSLGLAACGQEIPLRTVTDFEPSATCEGRALPVAVPYANDARPMAQALSNTYVAISDESYHPEIDWTEYPLVEARLRLVERPEGSQTRLCVCPGKELIPDVPGTYVVEMAVKDVHGCWSEPEYVTVEVALGEVEETPECPYDLYLTCDA